MHVQIVYFLHTADPLKLNVKISVFNSLSIIFRMRCYEDSRTHTFSRARTCGTKSNGGQVGGGCPQVALHLTKAAGDMLSLH